MLWDPIQHRMNVHYILTSFIIPTDAHNYKTIRMLKIIKIPTTAWYATITLTTSLTTSTIES